MTPDQTAQHLCERWMRSLRRTPAVDEMAAFMSGVKAVLESAGSASSTDTAWRTDFANAPTEAYEFFLVRPQGLHRGKPWYPTIVQRVDGEFYTSDNELEPIYFGQNEADDHPMKTTLEWRHFPADWCTVSQTKEAYHGISNALIEKDSLRKFAQPEPEAP